MILFIDCAIVFAGNRLASIFLVIYEDDSSVRQGVSFVLRTI